MTIKEYVASRKEILKNKIDNLEVKPNLIIIQVNKDEASNAYVKGKIKDLTEINARYEHVLLDESITEQELFSVIDKYNYNDDVDGILVQMPLPRQINEEHVKEYINPLKDVDGFHPMSKFTPCTPKGIMDYFKSEGVEFVGKNAVVIGRSNIVGRPLAKLLLNESCNVTVLHSKTSKEDLKMYVKNADILCVAVGRMNLIDSSYEVKPTCAIADVGINRFEGHLHGDVEANMPVKLQTPVPGGVGLLTRLSLLENLMLCYLEREK